MWAPCRCSTHCWLLLSAFDKNRVQRHVDVDKLIRAKYQDNLEFCQWLKAFFDQTAPPERDGYDPVSIRAKGKGGKRLDAHFCPGGGGARSAPRRPAPSRGAPPTMVKKKAPPTASTGGGAAGTRSPAVRVSRAPKQKENQRPGAKGTAGAHADAAVADAQLIKKNAELTSKCAELDLTLKGIEQERDFYFEKVRDSLVVFAFSFPCCLMVTLLLLFCYSYEALK
mmetsp:Transcript_39238/g.117999  ORF Transcript_39238/g.117999 Transcript_39238/m.117999 type:complete len:225 (-) Transcript_39238:713-1387(-)